MLVSSQTAVKGGHGFEIAVRMDNLRGGDWGEIQNKAHRVRSMHSRSSLFSVVFMCLISPTQKLNLKRVFGNTHFSFIFLFFDSKPASCHPICGIIIANKSFSSAKETLVCSFRPSGKNRRHLGCGNVMHSRGCAVQNKGITLKLSVVQDIKTLLIF